MKTALLQPSSPVQTCGEDHLLGDEFVIYDGELWKFNLFYSRYCVIVPTPVKLNVIGCISVCKENTHTHTDIQNEKQTKQNKVQNMTYVNDNSGS